MSLSESTKRAALNADLGLAFEYYAPPKYTFRGADPRNLIDKYGLHPAFNLFPVVGQGADIYTTINAINNGGIEANPAVAPIVNKSLPLFTIVKLGTGIATGLIADSLARNGNKRMAKVVAVLGGAIPIGAAIHNIGVSRRLT